MSLPAGPDILLYLAGGLATLLLARAAVPALRRRRRPATPSRIDVPPLPDAVRSRVTRDFDPAERDEVERLLAQYDNSETERVQLAILYLAKGNKADVAGHVSAARRDFRDVLYWAHYYEDDPHRLLRELLTHLEETRVLTRDEVQAVLRATRGTLYADAFEKLCEIMVRKGTRLTQETYQQVDRLGRTVKQPEQLWAPLEEKLT